MPKLVRVTLDKVPSQVKASDIFTLTGTTSGIFPYLIVFELQPSGVRVSGRGTNLGMRGRSVSGKYSITTSLNDWVPRGQTYQIRAIAGIAIGPVFIPLGESESQSITLLR